MVVKEALQKWAARVLRPWLQQEAEMEFEVSLFGIRGVVRDFNLNATSLNSTFMESSRLVIKSVTFGEVVVKFTPWRSPVFTLQIHGMRIVLSPRPLDDEFWENNDQQWTAEQERKNILLCIDPQGAALNAASERVTGTKTSSSCFVTMLTHMVLQCSRLVLHNTSIEVHIPERNLCEIQAESATGNTFYRCCIRAKTFSLEDGFSGHNKLPGGFLIAAMISALYSYRGSKGCKTCSIKDLGLELKRLDSCSSHIDSVNEKYVIFFKDLMVFAKLKNLQLTDLEFGILELRFGLYPRDMNLLMIILEHINYSAAKSAVSAYPRSHEEKCKHGMSSGNRWQRALENINRFSPKCRLQKLVEIVILRLRYAKAYESWLLELGMGLKGHVGSKLKKVKSKQFAGCIEGLWKEVCEKENKLPVEAVVQVRRAVRHRVLARLKKDDSEELDSDSRRQEHFLYLSFLVVPFSFLFQYLWKLIGNIYAFMFYSCSILLNSVYFFCPFLNKGPSCQPLVESPKAERQTHNFYDTKNSWYLFNASKLCYRVNICNVSITATCNEVNEMVLEEKIEKDVAISSIAGTSVLVLENLCLVYSSNGYVTEFSIVCEDVNGQIFSLASTERDINSGRFFQSRQSANQYIADNVKKTFLSSSSAPQVHCLDKSRNTVGRVGVFSISDLVLKDHQGQMWSDWESKNMKPSFHVGDASSTFTRKPFLLSEVQRFVIDPSPANSSLGLLQCNLALGQLFFDLDCSSLTYMILLLLQLLDAFQWTSSHGNKKPSHFSSFSGSYPIGRDGGWEELCNLYTDKMKQAMLSIIPEKTIHFTAAITGPKIQFSPFLEEYIKFEKQNAFAESHAEFSFVINLGNLEVAIWPAGQGRASTSLEEQDTYTTSKLEYIWLKKLPLLDDSRNFGSDFCMGHKQIGSNIYLKLDDAVMFLENTYEEKQLPLVKPLTITVESSVCRDEINSVLYLDKSFLASWGFTSSEVALICSVDELLYVIQIFEDYTGSMLDTFNQFAGRDKSPQQELCRDIKLSHNSDYSGSKLLFTSFKVVSTFDLETVDLCFEGSRGYFSPHSWKEVGASGYVTKYARRKGKSKMDDIWRKLALPNIDINLSVQKFVMEFSWVGSKQSLFSLRLSKIHAYVSDSITRNYRNLQNKIKEFKFRPVEETTGTHPRVLTEINFCNCTFSLCVGLHVYGHIFQEVTTRNTAGTGSSMVSQMTLGSACCALPHESYKMQLDEIQQKSPKRRNIPENLAGDLSSSVSRSWLLFEVDLSECSVTDSSLETLISEANKKISGGRRLCALFAVEEGFKSFSGNVQMFLSLASPFSELSTVDEARNPQTVSSFKQTKAAELEPKIPNGAIVAVKDVEEHLYMAVEKIENSYRLIGVLHYTLVGDRALFMVKYNEKSKLWFSLLSVHARNHDGEPYCVHYHPGSSLIDVSSTKNNAWELWCSIPFKHKEEDAEEELDFRGHSYDKTLYFVNKKSNGGFAFVNGLPMLVKKPGNPLKLKTFQHADFQTGETERDGSINGQPSYELAAKASVLRLEKVNVIVEKLDVTILYETSGMSHFFPLFRACMDSAQYVLQVSSSKLRIISTLRFTLQTYEAQRNMCNAEVFFGRVELLNPVDIGLVYRVVGADQMQGSVTSGKIPIYFCAILKKVDVLVSEQSLDTCLFLFTELNLGGPYTIKHSPVKAYGCKIENCTGLDLLCSFEDNEDINVAAWQEESFLLRRMISRRGLHLESFKDMTFKLVKSGMVSSTPVQVSLEDPGVTTIMTNIISHITGGRRVSGSLVVIDVSKQIEDGFSVVVSPMVRIQNASDLSLELHCRRPQQREDEGVVVLLKHGESIDDSMGSFDALKFSGEMRKALLSFSHGNYVLCVRPATSEKSILESERSPSFEWSENLKGVKAVRISGLFEKLTYHLKKKFSGQPTQSSFSTIHCGPKMTDAKFKDLYFLVRTTRRKLPVTRSHASEQRGSESSTVAFYEQQDILILPTIHVSNLLEVEIAVSSDTNADEIDEHSGNHPIVQGGCKTYMYEDLSNLFLTIILCDLKQKSNPVNVGELGKLAHSSKSDMHGLDVELDFGDGKNFAMLRLSRGETGLLEAIIYTPYALKNDTDMPLVCFASEQKTFFLWRGKGKKPHESMSSGHGVLLNPKSKISWFQKSDKILIQRSEQNAVVSSLDLEFFSGFTEISLEIQEETGLKDLVKLGVGSQLALSSALEPTQTIYLVPRYIVVNQSSEDIVVCPKGLQETGGAKRIVSPGQQAILHMKIFPGEDKAIRAVDNNLQKQRNAGIDLSLYFQFSLTEPGWSWSGPICAASLGRFFLKFRSCSNILEDSAASGNTSRGKQSSRFAVVDVKEERSSLIIYFNMQSPESLPYQINNSLRNASILFHQKELTETEILNAGATVGYVWDDLSLDHELIVQVAGTQFSRPISLDKLCTWKPFHKRQNKGFSLTLSSCNGDEISDKVDLSKVGYEVYADGPIRILLLSEIIDTQKRRERKTQNQILCANIYCKVSYIGISLLEEGTKVLNSSNHDSYYMPIIVARTGNLMLESIIASKNTLCQFRVKTLEVDERWQGAPFAAMLRMHEQDNSDRDEAALHMSAIIYNGASNPYQVKYLSILLMAVDLNIDEDTLMKLVPFYRNSLAMTTSSKEIYFESFEIHPIKIIGSFLPGQPNANYTSAQETLRSLLHSVIKVPAIKRASVELNGILLSNALVTFRQLGIKCAQHYSWYIMRAIYIAKGSKLLPPAFASIFDDSASSSFHLFFDPSKGSVDLQGFTIGMFNLLRKGIKKKGFGTHRSIDLKHTMKKAGSNVLFAVITEVSDSVLKGAETSGLDGLVNGFRRGILKLAMEPSTLSTVIIKGSSTRRIKLDNSAGINEMYIEGYLQAMLDTLYRQVYVKVKVVDDQVILKNLPPSSALIDEIIKCTKNFLIAEGLLADKSSLAGYSPRRLRKDFGWRVGPQLKAVCEQLFIVFTIRALRTQTRKFLGKDYSHGKSAAAKEPSLDQKNKGLPSGSDSPNVKKSKEKEKRSPRIVLTNFILSSAVAYADGRLCRHIPNAIVRQIVSGFLLSFVE
ncbi:uncharacterized protein LOC131071412 isoform X6 [Cryptomeria japonica]|uniref:uncharacterized protein LOC131071412 isoform X6 n=1 Tax=Cryptomeria japonica TaxID=3369 RepID=UPI0027D9D537|nr:uncharacterized protein LOC131071412 isoform X6 [Cryptomeria japonica]